MIRGALLGALVALGVSSGCARPLAVQGEPGGNLLALTAKQGARADAHHQDAPLVLLIEDSGLRALDPVTALDRWTSPLEATAHPAANSTTVFVPLSGHRLAALDRASGAELWKIELPGEALSGLSANDTTVVATVVDHRKGRSRAFGLSALDGQLRGGVEQRAAQLRTVRLVAARAPGPSRPALGRSTFAGGFHRHPV